MNYLGNSKNIDIKLKLHKSNLKTLVNEDKFLQVILNLLDNSISVSKDNTSILIQTTKLDDNYLSIKFYDQGRGVNFVDKEKIFNRFYTDRGEIGKKHSGLGLSICREIIKNFHGSIELTESDNSDFSGACFIVSLPLKAN